MQRLFNVKGIGQPPVAPTALEVAAACGAGGGAGVGPGGSGAGADAPWFVATVAAQCRSRDQLRAFMLSAAGVDFMGDPKAGGRPADALLFVSGSHPARSLPVAGRWAIWWERGARISGGGGTLQRRAAACSRQRARGSMLTWQARMLGAREATKLGSATSTPPARTPARQPPVLCQVAADQL